MSLQKMKFLMTILAEIGLSLHTDDDDSGSTRQQGRQEGDSVKPCQEKQLVAKNGETAMQQVGEALEMKYEGNAQCRLLSWQSTGKVKPGAFLIKTFALVLTNVLHLLQTKAAA